MKIFYLITKSEVGGAQTHVAQLCSYFVKQGNQVVVMSFGKDWLKEEIEKNGGIFISNNFLANSFNPFKLFKASKKIKSELSIFKPDIFCCHSSVAGFIGRFTVRNKIPTIFTAHGWDFASYRSWYRRWLVMIAEKFAANYCSKIICVSNFTRDLALKHHIASMNKFSVIYNGVELREINKIRTEELPLKIFFVGRLAIPKNPIMLIEAYANLNDSLKEKSKIMIVGDGPQKKYLKDIVVNLNLSDKVEFLGSLPQTKIFELFLGAAVVVLPSRWESFGMSVLEAMSFGVPVVASDVGGLKELIINESGILFDSTNNLTKILEKILLNEKLRKDLGVKGCERSRDFSVENMCIKTKLLYESIIKNNN